MSLRLDLEWRTTLLTLLLLPALVALGFWQLDRAEEKRVLEASYKARALAAAVKLRELDDWSPEALAFRRVALTGHYLPAPQFYLDNRIREGRYGHDVISVFIDESAKLAVLLNRGWVAGDPSRRSLPEIDTPSETLLIEAQVYVSPGDPYVLEADEFTALTSPMLVQQNSTPPLRAAVSEATGFEVFPRELRLSPDAVSGFRRDWPVVNLSEEKHRGYALQWFTMAAVLLLVFLLRSSNILDLLRRRSLAPGKES
ncbi:MAG: SURF1 family protein [Pseudomonadota bacterium]